jgi:predicted HTH transcriptional regulator
MNRILRVYSKNIFTLSENFLEIVFPFGEEFINGVELVTELDKVGDKVGDRVGDKVGDRVGDRVGDILTENQRSILLLFAEDSKISAKKISEKIGISTRKVEVNIKKLKDLKIIERVGAIKGGHWVILDNNLLDVLKM